MGLPRKPPADARSPSSTAVAMQCTRHRPDRVIAIRSSRELDIGRVAMVIADINDERESYNISCRRNALAREHAAREETRTHALCKFRHGHESNRRPAAAWSNGQLAVVRSQLGLRDGRGRRYHPPHRKWALN